MRIVFMGTPDFAVKSLEALCLSEHEVIGVVTQPDKPVGRRKIIQPGPVKVYAEKQGLEVYQPYNVKDRDAVDYILGWQPDLIVTAAYGQILPLPLLDRPRHKAINVHASLLPKYRGAAPINRAIIEGEKVSGVTIIYMTERMDAGDIILQKEFEISDEMTAGELTLNLSEVGAELLLEAVDDIAKARVMRKVQDESLISYAPMLKREDELIDWSRTSREINNLIRGLNPSPGAFTYLNERVFKLWRAAVLPVKHSEEPGTILQIDKEELLVATGDSALNLLEVQPAGRKPMSIAAFLQGSHLAKGDMFGERK